MAVTGQTIRDALSAVGAVGKQMRSFDDLAVGADGALRQAPAGLTGAGAASFLATMAQESAYHRTTTEYGSGQSYAPYIGRTFEQITWQDNYDAFGAWCAARGLVADPDVFVKNPATLSDYRWAWLGGTWYFEAKGLWAYANRGDHYSVSQGVNRGVGAIGSDKVPNGWNERKAMFDAYRRAGDTLLPSRVTAPPAGSAGPDSIPALEEGDVSAAVHRLAAWLNRWFPGYADTPIPLSSNPAEQRYGPKTSSVLAEFQRRSGITGGDGKNIGSQTRQKLWDAGYRP